MTQIDVNIYVWAGLELSFQRIGLQGWSPTGILQSWAAAPIADTADGVAVACPAGEAIWIGVHGRGCPKQLVLGAHGGWRKRIIAPPDWQVGGISKGGVERPLAIAKKAASLKLLLKDVDSGPTLAVMLIRPKSFSCRFGGQLVEPAPAPEEIGLYSRIPPPPPAKALSLRRSSSRASVFFGMSPITTAGFENFAMVGELQPVPPVPYDTLARWHHSSKAFDT